MSGCMLPSLVVFLTTKTSPSNKLISKSCTYIMSVTPSPVILFAIAYTLVADVPGVPGTPDGT